MVNNSISVKVDGNKTLEQFQQLIRERSKYLKETSEQSVSACALDLLRSIRALTTKATKASVKKEVIVDMVTKHGFGDKENIYKHWLNMRNRCNNPNYKYYDAYGGRGISICEDWNDYATFRRWSLDNGYKYGLTLDRINTNENYTPNNCRWVTWKTQQNNKRNNHYITYNGVTHTMKEWSEIRNINWNIYSTAFANFTKSNKPWVETFKLFQISFI